MRFLVSIKGTTFHFSCAMNTASLSVYLGPRFCSFSERSEASELSSLAGGLAVAPSAAVAEPSAVGASPASVSASIGDCLPLFSAESPGFWNKFHMITNCATNLPCDQSSMISQKMCQTERGLTSSLCSVLFALCTMRRAWFMRNWEPLCTCGGEMCERLMWTSTAEPSA